MRALLEGDDSNLQGVLTKADANIIAWANKKRPAALITAQANTQQARTALSQLDRDIERIRKKVFKINPTVNIPKNAAKSLKDIADVLPRLKDTKATITVNRAGNADVKVLRDLARIATSLKDKTVTITTNFQQNGTPPPPGAGGGRGAGGGPVPPPGGGGGRGGAPIPIPWGARMNNLQSRGYYSVAAGAALSGAFTAPLVAGGTAIVKFAGDYQEAMQHVATLTDVGKDEIGALHRQVLQLSDDKRIRQGPEELADALYYVTSTGRKGAEGMDLLKASAIGASAGLGTTKVVANTVTTVLDAYNMSSEKAARVTDVLTEAVRFGKGEAAEYAAAFPKLIAIASQAGVSFEEVAAQMASATRLGLTPSESATALRQVFSNLINPSEKASKALKEIGVSAGELRAALAQKGLFNTLKDLTERTGGRIGPITELFGSIRALTSFLSTTGNATLEDYKKTLDAINNASGSASTAAGIASETYRFQLDRLQSAINRALIEAGDRALPKLTPLVEMMGEKLPTAIGVAVKAWDDMDPAMKEVLKVVVGFLAAIGPLKMLTGTVQILFSAIGSLIGANGLAGLAKGISGLTGLSAMAAWPITLALVAAAIGLAATEWENFKAKVEDAQTAMHNAKMAAEALQKNMDKALQFSTGSAAAKTAITKLAADAKEAGGNAAKLIELIRRATAEKAEIGKDMKLSPIGRAVVENEFQRFINNLSSQAIDIDVNLKTRVDAARATPNPNAPAAPLTLAERARRAGVSLPKQPEATWQRDPTTLWVTSNKVQPGIAELSQYNNLLDTAIEKITKFEEAQQIGRDAKGNLLGPVKTQNAALTEQTKIVEKLKDAELARERARLTKLVDSGKAAYGSDDFRRAEAVETEYVKRRDKIQADHAKDKAAADERQRIAAADLAKAQEETAERLRRIEVQALQKRMQAWQTFGSAVDSVAASLSKTGSEKGETSKLAVEAQMARKEFAGIPPELRAMVIGIAAINDEMKRLTDTRDQMRNLFSDLYKDAVRTGSPTAGIVAQAREMEKSLNFANRMKSAFERGQGLTNKVSNESEYNRGRYSDRIEQLQGAGSKQGAKYSADAYVDAGNSAQLADGMVGIARGFIGQGQDNPDIAKAMGSLFGGEWCVGFVNAVRKKGGLPKLAGGLTVSSIRAEAQKSGAAYTGTPNVGDVATIKNYKNTKWHTAYVATVNRQKGTFTTIGGNEGAKDNSQSRVKEGNEYSYNHAGIVFIRSGGKMAVAPVVDAKTLPQKGTPVFPSTDKVTAPKNAGHFDGKNWVGIPAPPVEQAAPTAIPVTSKVGKRAAATPTLQTTSTQARGNVRTPEYDGKLLNMGLPKGWGAPVTEHGMAEGESRSWQLKYQDMIMDTKTATKQAKDLGLSLDQYAAVLKILGKERDMGDDVARANDSERKEIRQNRRNAYFSRRNGGTPLTEFFYDAGQGKYNRTPVARRREMVESMISDSLGGMQGENDKLSRESFNRSKVRGFGANDLARGDIPGADRSIELGKRRVDIWNSSDLEKTRKDIKALTERMEAEMRKGTFEGSANAMGAAEMIRKLKAEHDKSFQARVDSDTKDFNAENMDKVRRAIIERNKELTKTISLLGYENSLTQMNAADRERAVAIEERRRQVLEESLKLEPNASPARRKALEADAYSQSRRYGRSLNGRDSLNMSDENKAFNDNAAISSRGSASKLALIGRMPADSPELAIQLKLIEERGRLEAENLTRNKNSQIDVEKRLQTIESQVRAEDEINRLQTIRGNLLSTQNDLYEGQKQNELALAKTAKQKLEIEWKYQDAQRARVGTPTSEAEKIARLGQIAIAQDAERIEKLKSGAEEARDAFSSALQEGITDPLKGAESLVKNIANSALKYWTDRAAKSIFPESGGGFLDILGIRKQKQSDAVLPDGDATFNQQLQDGQDPIGPRPMTSLDAFFKDIYGAATGGNKGGFAPEPRQRGGATDIATAIQQALMSGLTVGALQVSTVNTTVSGANVNVAGGGGGIGSLFGGKSGGSGGGAATTPSIRQDMETTNV